MAYVDGFEYDIFISYAHYDNETGDEDKHGWVEQFYKELDITFGQRNGRTNAVKIWWDDRLEGNSFFDQSIQEGIHKSAIMLCLMSPNYLESEYCKDERELFYKKAQEEALGLKVGDRSRIMNLLLYNIHYSKWPKELSGTSGFPFYQAKNEDDQGYRQHTGDIRFQNQLQELVTAITNLLNAIKKPPPPPPPPTSFSIFFGDVPDSLRTVRKRTILELEKNGFNIIHDVPPPFPKHDHERTVKEKIEGAGLSVHLLDQYPGREIEGEETIWYPQSQVEIGLLSNNPQMIWVPAETQFEIIEEEPYKTFMQSLESGKQSSKKIDFIRGSKSELTQQITSLVEQLKKEREQPVPQANAVLLDTHKNDQLYAWEVGKSLLENGIQAYINPAEDDPKRNANTWEGRIGEVNKLIFFYGKVTWEWVRGRMNAALQSIVTNYYPVEEFIVFMVPPHKDPGDISLKQWVLKVNIFNSSDNPQLDMHALQRFVESIKKPPHER